MYDITLYEYHLSLLEEEVELEYEIGSRVIECLSADEELGLLLDEGTVYVYG